MLDLIKSKGTLDFSRNVWNVSLGIIISQMIILLASPFITRIYSPEEIGVYSFINSSTVVLILIITLTYEFSIVLPKFLSVSEYLTRVSVWFTLFTSSCIGITLFLLSESVSELINIPEKALNLLPFIAFFTALGSIGIQYLTKFELFPKMARVKVGQTLAMISFQLVIPFIATTTLGLVIGLLIGRFTYALYSLSSHLKNKVYLSTLKTCFFFKKYKNHPLFVFPSSILSSTSNELPLLAIAPIFGTGLLGFYGLAYRVLMLPVSLISISTGQVFFQKLSVKVNDNTVVSHTLLKVWLTLFVIGIVPFTIVFLFGDTIFGFVFGNKWAYSGVISAYLTPMIFLNFISTSTSKSLLVLNRHKWLPVLAVVGLVVKMMALYSGYKYEDFELFLILLCLGQSLVYLLTMSITYFFARIHDNLVYDS